MYKYYKILLQS